MGCGQSTPSCSNRQNPAFPSTHGSPTETHSAAYHNIPSTTSDGRGKDLPVAPSRKPTAEMRRVPTRPPSILLDCSDVAAKPEGAPTTPYSPVTVFSIASEPDSADTAEFGEDLVHLRKKCPRFRILIIGKANAGKTTILQKFCNTTENPIIWDQNGQELDKSIVEPTDGRGAHDINNELTFSSNDAFVFHDSAGFEAASVSELEEVQNFIAKRAATHDLKDQLHAIWYCLPTDSDRPLSEAEMSFFQQKNWKAPVIAIFTKYDGMILKEYNRLRFEENYSKKNALAQAPESADRLFQESDFYLKRVQSVPFPPEKSLRVQDMHEPRNQCDELSRQTLEALNSKRLQQLFVSMQQNNLSLSTEFAIKEYLLKAVRKAGNQPTSAAKINKMVQRMLACYNHLFTMEELPHPRPRRRELQGLIATILSTSSQGSSSLQVLQVGIAVLIIAEESFWLENNPSGSVFGPAVAAYQSSERHLAVINQIYDKLSEVTVQDYASHREEELVHIVLEIVRGTKA